MLHHHQLIGFSSKLTCVSENVTLLACHAICVLATNQFLHVKKYCSLGQNQQIETFDFKDLYRNNGHKVRSTIGHFFKSFDNFRVILESSPKVI